MKKIMNVLELPLLPAPEPVLLLPVPEPVLLLPEITTTVIEEMNELWREPQLRLIYFGSEIPKVQPEIQKKFRLRLKTLEFQGKFK